jgi:hypothetical protein
MSLLADDGENPLSTCETAARIESTSDSGRDDRGSTARVDHLCKVLGIQPHEFGAYIQSALEQEGVSFVEDVWTGSGSGRWAKLIPNTPKWLLLGKSDDVVKIALAVAALCGWLSGRMNRKVNSGAESLAAELASLPPTTRLDKLLWHAPKKLSDILKDAIAHNRSVLRVLNVHKVDTSVLPIVAVLGYFNNDRCIPTDVLNFDVADQIADALLDTRNRLVCVYGVSGGGKTTAMLLASQELGT